MRPPGPLLLSAVLVLAAAGTPTRAQAPVGVPAEAASRQAARAGAAVLAMEDLEELLLLRHAFSPDGRDILRHLVQTRVIAHLGDEGGVEVRQEEINALWDEIDRQARKQGIAGGMAEELARSGMTAGEFREVLRLQIVQQILTRRSLGLDDDAPVSGEQQAIWIDQVIQERGLETVAPPWVDGVIAHCGEVKVPVAEFAALLRDHLPEEEIREACFHLMLLDGIRQRMPDLAEETVAQAIDREIARRRAEVEADPTYKGLGFESLLNAQGMSVASLRRDPAVAIAALSTLWVDRAHGPDGLREVYGKERTFFEDRFGLAIRTHAIFLRGAKFVNEWNPRTFEDAEAQLAEMAAGVSTLEEFSLLAQARSEDVPTREEGGAMGWITRGDPGTPEEVRTAIFDLVAAGAEIPAEGRPVGPVRLENGSLLLWISARRESPGWDVMSGHVHRELRRRFLNDVLRQEDVVTFLDE